MAHDEVSVALQALQNEWEKTTQEAPSSGPQQLPDGTYPVAIMETSVGRSKAGRLQARIDFAVTDGDFKGQKEATFIGLETRGGRGAAYTALVRLGITPPPVMQQLPQALSQAQGKLVEVAVKTNDGGYRNVFINRLLAGNGF